MTDAECVGFLQWALPRLGLRWAGFRKVRRQVCKRITRRLRALELPNANAYRRYLETAPAEWGALDACCWVSISRFYRDRAVFDALRTEVLPGLARQNRARGEKRLRAWCAGCAAGEEAYTLALIWEFALRDDWPDVRLEVVGTDADENQLQRAGCATYPASSLRGLPALWRARAFQRAPSGERLRRSLRKRVRFELQDLRREMPAGPFDLVLCRNVAFTYFEEPLQTRVGRGIARRLTPGGALVIGAHEQLPEGLKLIPLSVCPSIYRIDGLVGPNFAPEQGPRYTPSEARPHLSFGGS